MREGQSERERESESERIIELKFVPTEKTLSTALITHTYLEISSASTHQGNKSNT